MSFRKTDKPDGVWTRKWVDDDVITPARTLFVAQSWPPDADPLVFFTSIAAALVHAGSLNPTSANPCLIEVFPGTYSDPITLVSNVHMFAHTARSVIQAGAITWLPGQGVNAPQAALTERVLVTGFRLQGAFSIDATAKTASTSTFEIRIGNVVGPLTVLGRSAGVDFYQQWCGVLGNVGALSFTNCSVVLYGGVDVTAGTMLLAGNAGIEAEPGQMFCAITMTGTANGYIHNTELVAAIALASGTFLNTFGCKLFAPITVAAGGAADVRGAEYGSNANLAGAGTIDRSTWRTTLVASAIGANAVPIAPPLPDGNYNVVVTQIAGTPGAVLITAKTGTGFTLTDAVGGNDFDLTIVKE